MSILLALIGAVVAHVLLGLRNDFAFLRDWRDMADDRMPDLRLRDRLRGAISRRSGSSGA